MAHSTRKISVRKTSGRKAGTATRQKAPPSASAPSPVEAPLAPAPETVLVMRVCNPDMRSSHGFTWPTSGPVECNDWSPTPRCGNGLHGWLWGFGDISSRGGTHDVEGAKWLVVEVVKADVVELTGKVKFPRGVVVFCGDVADAVKLIAERAPAGLPIIRGTATAGYRGTAAAGDRGTATAGVGGTIVIAWWDSKRDKYRTAAAEVGEDGIEPGTAYVLDTFGEQPRFVRKPS